MKFIKKIYLSLKSSTNSRRGTLRLGFRTIKFGSLGENVIFDGKDTTFILPRNINIGSHVFFNSGCYFYAHSSISIGSGCAFGPRVMLLAGSHNYNSHDLQAVPYDNRYLDLPITIGDNVWVGGNVTIAPGATIGEGSVIAAGCTVAGDVPAYSVLIGQKATVLKERDAEIYRSLVKRGMVFNQIRWDSDNSANNNDAEPVGSKQ